MKTLFKFDFQNQILILIYCCFILFNASIDAQNIINTQEVTLSPSVLQELEDKGICKDMVFTIDLAALNNTVKSYEDELFSLQLNLGTLHNFQLELSRFNHGSEGSGIDLPASSFYLENANFSFNQKTRLRINENDFTARIVDGTDLYRIRPLSDYIEGMDDIWLLCHGTVPPVPEYEFCETPLGVPTISIVLHADFALYQFMGQDEQEVKSLMVWVAEEAVDQLSALMGIGFFINIIDVDVRKEQDSYCCTLGEIQGAVNEYYIDNKICVQEEADAAFLFSGRGFGFDGGTPGNLLICEGEEEGPNPVASIKTISNGISLVPKLDLAKTFAHELAHMMSLNIHTDSPNNPNPMGAELCANGIINNMGELVRPLMCIFGGDWYLTADERQRLLSFMELNCDVCLDDEPKIDCAQCRNTVEITADNLEPLAGCEGEDIINYEVTVCSDCDGENLSLQIAFNKNNQELISAPGFTSKTNNLNRILCLDVVLEEEECRTFTFTTRLVNATNTSAFTTTANLRVTGEPDIINTDNVELDPPQPLPFPVDQPVVANFLSSLLSSIPNSTFACIDNHPSVRGDLEIEGTLIVDTDYCVLGGSTWLMQPGATIIVQAGNTLRFEDAAVFACDQLWGQITVQNGATLIVKRSLIADAETAIVAEQGAHLVIRDATFTNNFKGIVINGSINFDEPFEGNTFQAEGTLKAPRTGQIAKVGVNANNAGFLMLGSTGADAEGINDAPNQFIGLKKGIIVGNSLPFIINASFKDIKEGGGAGRAISTYNNILSIIGNDDPNLGFVSFENCDVGVFNNQSPLWVRNSIMANMIFGVRALLNQNQAINILNNSISDADVGVDLLFNGNSSVLVSENNIGVRTNGIGIRVQEFSTSGACRIEDNTINMNEASAGILHRGGNKAQINHNTINVLGGIEFDGIRLESGDNHQLTCNLIAGTGTTGTGILLHNTPSLSLQCNTIHNTALGINFWGINDGTQMEGNTFGDHEIGLLMGMLPADGNAVIGHQIHNGNLWGGNYSSGFGARHLGSPSIISQSFFFVDAVEHPLFTTTVDASFNWFLNASNNTSSFDCSTSGSCPEGPGVRFMADVPALDELDYTIAKGKLSMDDVYEPALQWTAAMHLYQRLEAAPDLVKTGTEMEEFRQRQSSSTIGQLQEINHGLKSLVSLPNSLATKIALNIATTTAKVNELIAYQSLFFNDKRNRLIAEKIEALIVVLDSLSSEKEQLSLDQNRFITNMQNALILDNRSIQTDEVYQNNLRLVNDIYLQTIVKGNDQFSRTQASELYTIAQQCPLAGGDAVWLARSLYSLVDDQLRYDDSDLCTNYRKEQEDNSTLEENRSYKILLYPNPTKDQFWMNYNLGDSKSRANIVLYDIFGNEVLNEVLSTNKRSQLINTSTLKAGTYFCSIYLENQIIATEKLVIIK